MSTVFLSLGSNLGDRLVNIKKTLHMLESQVDIQGVSSVYETEPWGLKGQPWFLNIVCAGATNLPPRILLDFVKEIEHQLGRQPTVRFGPRLIDIDILFYNGQIIHSPELHIPHPRLAERAFVLIPLAEIAPDLKHPETGKTVRAMLAELESSEEVRKYPGLLSHSHE